MRVPVAMQRRARALTAKSKAGGLSSGEEREGQQFVLLDHLFTVAKIRPEAALRAAGRGGNQRMSRGVCAAWYMSERAALASFAGCPSASPAPTRWTMSSRCGMAAKRTRRIWRSPAFTAIGTKAPT